MGRNHCKRNIHFYDSLLKMSPTFSQNWRKFSTFRTHFQQTIIKMNVLFAMVSPKHYQIVRKLPISLNHLSNHFSKVQERKIPKFSQINLLTIADVSFIILFCLSYQ